MSGLRDERAATVLERRRPGPSRPEAYRYLAALVACPYLYLGLTSRTGLGVFTARPVAAGAVVVVDEDGTLRRRALPLAAALAQGWDQAHDLFQIDHDLFLPPRGCFDDLFNHSCEPSGGWRLTEAGARFLRDPRPRGRRGADLRLFLSPARPGRADGLRLRDERVPRADRAHSTICPGRYRRTTGGWGWFRRPWRR